MSDATTKLAHYAIGFLAGVVSRLDVRDPRRAALAALVIEFEAREVYTDEDLRILHAAITSPQTKEVS
jgi:hypothetical protein